MCFRSHIYPVSVPCLVFILNIFLPGTGTVVQSYCWKGGCWNYGTFLLACAQGLLVPYFFGWIWAIWHGYEVYRISTRQQYNPVVTEMNQVNQ